MALVIGNGDYTKANKLKNPTNDATDVGATLRELGWELVGGQAWVNLDKETMEQRMAEFGQKLRGGGVGLFYYAGHGMQVAGHNYLVPVDAKIESETDIKYRNVDVDYVLGLMDEAGNGLNFVILDACRNNPFGRSFSRDGKANNGFAKVDAPTGTLIAYATSPDKTAEDGKERNGTYTAALLKQLRVKGLDHLNLFQEVRDTVYDATSGKQIPWESNSTRGRFYFNPVAVAGRPTPLPVTPAQPDDGPEPVITRRSTAELEREAWLLVRNSTDAQDFRDFLENYSSGANAGPARIKLEQLVWAATRANGSKAALEAYLKEFPQGDNVPTARLMLNRLARASQPPPGTNAPGTNAPAGGNAGSNAARPQSNQYGIEFVALSAGTFTMGSANGDSDEKPTHQVRISQPFEMGKYEVTQEEWEKVMGSNPSYFKNCPRCPVEQVSWDDAQQFIAKLNQLRDGYRYRLPTEAEWEYAARAGGSGDYGNVNGRAGALDEIGWYYENAGDRRLSDSSWSVDNLTNNHNRTHPVGEKKANDWGLYDMHGNVWEWVGDWYGDYPRGKVTDPSGPSGGSDRVARGGSWDDPAAPCRAADRISRTPGYRSYYLGLRLVRTR